MKHRKNIKPILFSTPMVQAILAGTKKQTRRVVWLPNSIEFPEEVEFTRLQSGYPDGTRAVFGYMDEPNSFSVRGYQVGDILWVRETTLPFVDPTGEQSPVFYYRADFRNDAGMKAKWKPSIFMPKEAARIFLKVTDVRVEELQEITEADAIAEGIETGLCDDNITNKTLLLAKDYLKKQMLWLSPTLSFKTLWQSINGAESWERNPLVWVYSFEQIDKPEDF